MRFMVWSLAGSLVFGLWTILLAVVARINLSTLALGILPTQIVAGFLVSPRFNFRALKIGALIGLLFGAGSIVSIWMLRDFPLTSVYPFFAASVVVVLALMRHDYGVKNRQLLFALAVGVVGLFLSSSEINLAAFGSAQFIVYGATVSLSFGVATYLLTSYSGDFRRSLIPFAAIGEVGPFLVVLPYTPLSLQVPWAGIGLGLLAVIGLAFEIESYHGAANKNDLREFTNLSLSTVFSSADIFTIVGFGLITGTITSIILLGVGLVVAAPFLAFLTLK